MNRARTALMLLVLICVSGPRAVASNLTPRVYLPFIIKPAWAPVMGLYIENRTEGMLCYQILDVGPIECSGRQGKVFYKTVAHGKYKFWGNACDDTYVLGLAPFFYRKATLSFACYDAGGGFQQIWAKMYEFSGG